MKMRYRNSEGVILNDGRVLPLQPSEHRELRSFVQRSDLIEWSDIAERNGRIRSQPLESLASLMVPMQDSTGGCQEPPGLPTA